MQRGKAGILDPVPDDLHSVREREAVRVLVRLQRGIVQEGLDAVMGQLQGFNLLAHQFRRLGTHDRMAAEQVRLDFVVGGLDLPALVAGPPQRSALSLASG